MKYSFQSLFDKLKPILGSFSTTFSIENRKSYPLFHKLLLVVFVLSTAFKFYYVFALTGYKEYVVSDMGHYFYSAVRHYDGDIFNIANYVIWPPFFTRVLAFYFRIIAFFGLTEFRLELILGFHIILGSLAVLCLYSIGCQIMKKRWWSFGAATLYAFSFPIVYMHSNMLTENFSIPLVIIAIWLLFSKQNYRLVLSGILLALAAAARPGFAPLALLFGIYLLAVREGFMNRIFKASWFSIGFLTVIFLVLVQNSYLSGGKLKSLGAAGGMNFLFNIGDIREMNFYDQGYYWVLGSPTLSGRIEYPSKTYSFLPCESDTLYRKAKELIREDPTILFRKFNNLRYLYFGQFFPTWYNAWFMVPGIEIFRYLLFFMSLLSLLAWIVYKTRLIDRLKLSLLLSIAIMGLFMGCLYTAEHRYLLSVGFAFYITSFTVLAVLSAEFRPYKKQVTLSIAVILSAFILGYGIKTLPSKKILFTISKDRRELLNLYQARLVESEKTYFVDRIDFPLHNTFTHYRYGSYGDTANFFIDFKTRFKVNKTLAYEFIVFSDDGFNLSIDGHILMAQPYSDGFITPYRWVTQLTEGVHTLRMSYFQHNAATGLVVFYKNSRENSVYYRVGEDSPYFKFLRQN